MIFGGVPIIVIIPPKILAKARGMRMILGDRFCLTDVFSATGSMSANAPTLFIMAENMEATLLKLEIWATLYFEKGIIFRAMRSTTPELLSARLIISTAATVITAGCPKPMNILDVSIIKLDFSPPNIWSAINKVHKERIDTMSYRNRPQTNREKVNIIMLNMAIWSIVITVYLTHVSIFQ